MDRPITRYEFESHKVQVREDLHNLDQNIDHVRTDVQLLSKSIDDMKFSLMKAVLTGIGSFISGGGIVTAILKAMGKL